MSILSSIQEFLITLHGGKVRPSTITSFTTSGGMSVKGFIRDYKLISKIKPEHFIYGAESGPIRNYMVTSSSVSTNGDSSVNMMNPPVYLSYENADGSVKSADLNAPSNSPELVGVVELNPKEVFDELQTIPHPFSLNDIDKKIFTYKKMLDIVRVESGGGNKETILDIIERLEFRKKYSQSSKYSEFFDSFKCTSDELINVLLDNHTHLKIGNCDDFIAEFPTDAMEIMISYSDMVESICGKKPVFYIIAKEKDFKKAKSDRTKRDPILLVQSPMGFYWQILGTWDEEMVLINDL